MRPLHPDQDPDIGLVQHLVLLCFVHRAIIVFFVTLSLVPLPDEAA